MREKERNNRLLELLRRLSHSIELALGLQVADGSTVTMIMISLRSLSDH
jgi:hypothetical protein